MPVSSMRRTHWEVMYARNMAFEDRLNIDLILALRRVLLYSKCRLKNIYALILSISGYEMACSGAGSHYVLSGLLHTNPGALELDSGR